MSLEKDAPVPRPVESTAMGRVTAVPKVGGPIIITLASLLEFAALHARSAYGRRVLRLVVSESAMKVPPTATEAIVGPRRAPGSSKIARSSLWKGQAHVFQPP